MSSYKLTYFNFAGVAEPIRLLLSYGGVNFEDNRLSEADWPKLKPKTPFEQIPILEIDGKTLYQSNAISRFLAVKFGLLGSSEFEAFYVDATIETISDLRLMLAKWFRYTKPEEKAATESETLQKAAFYFGKLEAQAAKNGGYFVGGKLSAADIIFVGFDPVLSHILGKDYLAAYPTLKNLVDKVSNEPRIKSWIAKRPASDF